MDPYSSGRKRMNCRRGRTRSLMNSECSVVSVKVHAQYIGCYIEVVPIIIAVGAVALIPLVLVCEDA